MKRYAFDSGIDSFVQHDKGRWVKYADHAAALAERDALLVRAEATIERYRTVMESICATGLALGRSDVDNVVRESWETLKAIRECIAGGRGE